MSFNLREYIQEHDFKRTEGLIGEIVAEDDEHRAIRKKLLDLIDDNRGKVILVVGPFGAGKTTMIGDVLRQRVGKGPLGRDQLNEIGDFFYLGEFAKDPDCVNPNFFHKLLEKGIPIVTETHPFFLMPGLLEKYDLPDACIVEKPAISQELASRILLQAFKLPEEALPSIEGLVAGYLRLFGTLNSVIETSKFTHEMISGLIEYICFKYLHFEIPVSRNYLNNNEFGRVLEKIGLAQELSEEDQIGLEIALRMRLVVMDNGQPLIRSLYWRDKYKEGAPKRYYGLAKVSP